MDRVTISRDVDLEYSPDEGGWFFLRYTDDKTSQLYSSKANALKAWETQTTIHWGS